MRELASGGPVLITGGCGFIGTNLAKRFASQRREVLLFDNLSRPGVEKNLRWLTTTYPDLAEFCFGDIRDKFAVRQAVRRASAVFHFAAQVAVTTSVAEPVSDFDVNAGGTLNVLEAIRSMDVPPPLIFTSTNKVYGDLGSLDLRRSGNRYRPTEDRIAQNGVSEEAPLSFHSPYGCSKGAADQYVLDYSRSYGIPALVFRMSCIYGPHQFGTEDQGWVAHFLIRALNRQAITLYGDGCQVRDLLFVEDLVDAFLLALDCMPELKGRAFNIGGGPANASSLLEVLRNMADSLGERPVTRSGEWRTGDQRYYVSDTRLFQTATGWVPRVSVRAGIEALAQWILQFGDIARQPHDPPPALALHGGAVS